MPRILITGNGFDLNLSLPTSYSDMIEILNYIISSDSNLDYDSIYSKCLNYNSILKRYSKFEFDIDKINVLRSKIISNNWYQFFKKEYNIETWIDFENRIEFVLESVSYSISKIEKSIFSESSIEKDIIYFAPSIINSNIEIIELLIDFQIISFELPSNYILNESFLFEKYQHYIGVNTQKIANFLYGELTEFKSIFNLYFEVFIYPLYDNIKDIAVTIDFKTIDIHYTFNYTPTFEKIYKKQDVTTKYLHGKIDFNTNEIVLGVEKVSGNQIDKRYFVPFTKCFQKLYFNTDYKFINEFKDDSFDNYIFFFFGHSLDKSDKYYINEIFSFIKQVNSSIKKIVIIYPDDKSRFKLLVNLLHIIGKQDIENLMKNDILFFVQKDSKELKSILDESIDYNLPFVNLF